MDDETKLEVENLIKSAVENAMKPVNESMESVKATLAERENKGKDSDAGEGDAGGEEKKDFFMAWAMEDVK